MGVWQARPLPGGITPSTGSVLSLGVRKRMPLSLGSLARAWTFKLGFCPSDLGFTWFLESKTDHAEKHVRGNVVQFVVSSFRPSKVDLGVF